MVVIHEKQQRQFCAIHAVNNLLQLSNHTNGVDNLPDEDSHRQQVSYEWRCHGRLLNQKRVSPTALDGYLNSSTNNTDKITEWDVAATQLEFDTIAGEITSRELRLMEENIAVATTTDLSTIERFRSKHFTPFFGNYSYEVLETALSRRGIVMKYFHLNADTTEISALDQNQAIIGFIIHEEETNRDSLSYLRRLGSRIPIIRNVCRQGRHWWTITGVTRSCYLSNTVGKGDCNHVIERNDDSKDWFLIDSKMDNIPTLSSDAELAAFLKDVQSRGSLIFCCCVTQN